MCDYALDLLHNAFEAGAGEVWLDMEEDAERLHIAVRDNGPGMSETERVLATDPFYTDRRKHAGRKVGLGLPFLVQGVEQAGGSWSLRSEVGGGTVVEFSFPTAGIDCPPLGDLPSLLLAALSYPGPHELHVRRIWKGSKKREPGGYEMSRREIGEALGGFDRASALDALREYLTSQEVG
ncbi:MAG TPA: HAMP domain-containing sensor histidine kinase [Rectinemataceae bacterium]|nr:HAMP domain-containing sensor histidine kinase [Rectinemataceae bacterium]